jgi:hypothetical protein
VHDNASARGGIRRSNIELGCRQLSMNGVHLGSFDLNLLVALDALLTRTERDASFRPYRHHPERCEPRVVATPEAHRR